MQEKERPPGWIGLLGRAIVKLLPNWGADATKAWRDNPICGENTGVGSTSTLGYVAFGT